MTQHLNISLRHVPIVGIALLAVLVTMWLAAADLQPHSLYADAPGSAVTR